jgi:alpha-tubulin suppressor-like RCC1 family protein
LATKENSYILLQNGQKDLFATGDNGFGQIGNNSTTNSNVFLRVFG